MDQKRFCAMACACVCTVGGEGRMKGFMRRFTSTGQASIFAYRLGIQSAVLAARDIVKDMQVTNRGAEEQKLQFDLTIAFLVQVASVVFWMDKWNEATKTAIMDNVWDTYISDLQKNKDLVNAAFFVRDEEEKILVCRQIRQTSADATEVNLGKLQINLYALASILSEKRFSEYKQLLNLDEVGFRSNPAYAIPVKNILCPLRLRLSLFH